MLYKSAMMTQASGSVGGMTASRNRGGAYMRARVVPVNPASAQQVAVRTHLASLTSLWSNTLSNDQRTGWANYAANVPLLNALGDAIHVSGLNMYLRTNVPTLQVGLTRVDTAPTVFDLGSLSQCSLANAVSGGPTDFDVAYDNTDAWANSDTGALLIYCGRPVSQTINFYSAGFRFTGKVDGSATLAPTSPVTVFNPFGFGAGQRFFVNVRALVGDGRLTTSQTLFINTT